MAAARGRWLVCKVMGQQPHIQLTYRRTPPRNGKWFRFFGHGDEVDFSPTVRRPTQAPATYRVRAACSARKIRTMAALHNDDAKPQRFATR